MNNFIAISAGIAIGLAFVSPVGSMAIMCLCTAYFIQR